MTVNPGEALLRIQSTNDDQGSVALSGDTNNKDYSDYGYGSGVLNRLIDGWGVIVAETERQRDIRYVKHAGSNDLRDAGILKADEMYCPVRLIDANIRAEQPPTIAYITQSRRSIIFASPDGEKIDGLEKLEEDFTMKARYLGWEIPFIQTLDGAAAHGWDAVEILFDTEAPGNFVFEHIGHDCLIFAIDCENIESQEVVLIRKNLTAKQLRTLVAKDGFNAEQVEKLINLSKNSGIGIGTDDCCCETYKVFYKKEDTVYTCWYARNCDGYLRDSKPLFLGIRDVTQPKVRNNPEDPLDISEDYPPIYENDFPIVIDKYIESNDPKIVEICGRVKLDESSQEAASGIQSGLVNGILRAANVYASPQATNIDSQPNAAPKATNTVLFNGAIYDTALNFWHTPYPEAAVIQALQCVVTQNKTEQGGGINLATINRKDSGKTATEIQAADKISTELTSVQVILLSIFIRLCYAKAWRIYQNRVLQGAISVKDPTVLQLFGDDIKIDDIKSMRVISTSGAKHYIIKSSGDVDVIQRAERLNKLMQGWEVFGKTALASEYLKDIVRYAFPEDAARYIAVLDGAEQQEVNMLKQLLMKLSAIVLSFVKDPQGSAANIQQHVGELQQLQAQVQQALGVSGQPGVAGQQGGQPQQQQLTA